MAELDRAEICARIAQARTEAGMTQAELGETMEPSMHWRTVQTWESVKDPRVPWARLDEIARITGRSKEWLLHGTETVSSPDVVLSAIRDLDRRFDVELLPRLDALEEALRRLAEAAPAAR